MMDWHHVVVIISFTLHIFPTCGRTLTEILSYYNTINKVDFQHRIFRRSVTEPPERNIHFISHGRKFHMRLKQSKDIFSPSFIAVTVDRFGNEKPIKINMDTFYEGYVEEDATSHVTAHVEDNGMITATIETANESYIVEPMWRHVDNDPSHDMIVYKASDVKWNLTIPYDLDTGEPHVTTCGNNDTAEDEIEIDSNKRVRRDTCNEKEGKNTCSLHLVADYNFFEKIGRKDANTAMHYMLQVIKRVDVIYRGTCWDGVGKKIGVQVKKITVHKDWCDNSGGSCKARYNTNINGGWNVDRLLTEFSRSNHNEFCLAHLFTYQDFSRGVIGLAYVASRSSRIGGICSPKSRDSMGPRYHNCGLTTYVNWGRKLTTLEATLVTVHEIGHNFGSNHDPSRCAADDKDGKYVMYATSVTGEKRNNKRFSECSTHQIGGVLRSRIKCLDDKGARCGNGIVEKDEECDQGELDNDPCCVECVLTTGSKCSDSNSICCKDCQFAAADSKTCRADFTLECKGKTMCNGTSEECPTEAPKLESGVCNLKSFRRGSCTTNGECKSLCAHKGMKSCQCPAGESSCKVCCKSSGKCEPLDVNIYENDGVQCTISSGVEGLCDGGECQKLKRNVKETFKNLLTDFTLDKAVRFMQNNIVLTILFFSLLIWIPAGCIVNQIDKSEERKMIEKENMRDELLVQPKGSFKKKKYDEGVHVRTGQHVGT